MIARICQATTPATSSNPATRAKAPLIPSESIGST
jgi:hypothetical protein